MGPKAFDHSRVDSALYEDLDVPQTAATFICMIHDYMLHVRADPIAQEGGDETLERNTAQAFVIMINEDVVWPLAKQTVPEFRKACTLDQIKGMQQPLKYILTSVHPRLPESGRKTRQELIPHYIEVMLWRRMQNHIEYLAHIAGIKMDQSFVDRHEVDETVEVAQKVRQSYLVD